MHLLGRADDGIHRAGLNTSVSRCRSLIDKSDCFGSRAGAFAERFVIHAQQLGQFAYAPFAAGRNTLMSASPLAMASASGHAARITALAALRLRQHGINLFQRMPSTLNSIAEKPSTGTQQQGDADQYQKRRNHFTRPRIP